MALRSLPPGASGRCSSEQSPGALQPSPYGKYFGRLLPYIDNDEEFRIVKSDAQTFFVLLTENTHHFAERKGLPNFGK